MNRRILLPALALAAGVLAGCASGPKYSEIASSIRPIPAQMARVYFFRSSSMMGAALQPDLRVDGQVVGSSKPGGFFYVDEPSGSHVASVGNDTDKAIAFALDAGETKYLRTSPSFGLLVGGVVLQLEEPKTAKAEIQTLSLSGRSTARAAAPTARAPERAVQAAPVAPAGPNTVAAVLAAAQAQDQADIVRHLEDRNVDGTEWVFPAWNPQTYRDVHLVFRRGKVEAANQRDHTSGTYAVAGDKVCVELRSNAWGNTCYVVIEPTTGPAAHGLQVMELPNGNRLPLTIR